MPKSQRPRHKPKRDKVHIRIHANSKDLPFVLTSEQEVYKCLCGWLSCGPQESVDYNFRKHLAEARGLPFDEPDPNVKDESLDGDLEAVV